jgi:DNA repair protein RecO (recombination protein O)
MKNETLERVEGIILHTFDYQEFDQIISVLTEERGITRFIVKGANTPKRRAVTPTAPLTYATFAFVRGRGELLKCQEITPIENNLKLRDDFDTLQAACEMIKAVNSSQLPQKGSKNLFLLLKSFLKKLSETSFPQTLKSSFLLRLMRHDGLLHLSPNCSKCKSALTKLYLYEGESFCVAHAPPMSWPFEEEEANLLLLLMYSASFALIIDIDLESELTEKISKLFIESYKN